MGGGGDGAGPPNNCVLLCERGARRVVAFDVWARGDLTKAEDVHRACRGADCVWHIGALVGPYFPKEAYGPTKAQGEGGFPRATGVHPAAPVALRSACDGDRLLTVAVSPHQVYGPRDALFLTNVLKQARMLRIFGSGQNEVSMVYVDNYCHALILGERAFPALGKFYVVTDGPPVRIWDALDRAMVELGFTPLHDKYRVPGWLILTVAHAVSAVGWLLSLLQGRGEEPYVHRGRGPFKVRPFAIRMMMIDRSFDISAAREDLGYQPVYTFDQAWGRTLRWFKDNRSAWAP
eukprot:gene37340-23668_t